VEYLAYGSNMLSARLLRRVSSARDPRAVSMPGHVVRYRKLSVDGSAKCDLVPVGESSTAYGVLYDIEPEQRAVLDRFEGLGNGYHHALVTVVDHGRQLEVFTYLADDSHLVEGVLPYDWYRDQVVAGAREHGLPGAYVDGQLDVPATPDPDPERTRREREMLGGGQPG
jgi:hypothetical protein